MMPVRVLYVHHRRELGGAPTSLAYLIRTLDRERFDPHVYCPEGAAAELFRQAGATVHTGPVASFTHIWASVYRGRRWLLLAREVLRLPGHVVEFQRVLRRGGFSVVHINDSPPVPAAWLAYRAGIPVVWQLRSALPDGVGPRSRALRRVIRRTAAAAIAINGDVARSFGVSADVVPNAVDLGRFSPGDGERARRALGIEAGSMVVSYVGFIYPSKGYEDFLRAAATLRLHRRNVVFLLVGGGVRDAAFFRSARGRLLASVGLASDHETGAHRLANELSLGSSARFVPYTSKPEVVYRASAVVVAPSRGPELGRSVLEAAAAGVPVVASGSVDGAEILLPGQTGLLVPSGDPEALALAVGALLDDEQRRRALGSAARAHAERSFSPVEVARRTEAIYERVLAAASSSVPR